jgi:hydrogenase expression/formation protein HypD
VREKGNTKAIEMMWEVFSTCDSNWRGIGVIPGSGLELKEKYSEFDAEKNIEVVVEEEKEHKLCICGEILRGIKTPYDCKLFAKRCTPEDPVGPCMVSTEGTCSAYYKYGR